MAASDHIILVAGSVLSIRLQGKIFVVLMVIMVMAAATVMTVLMCVSGLDGLALGVALGMGVGAVGMGEEEAIDGEKQEERQASREGAPSEAMRMAMVMIILVGVCILLLRLSRLGLSRGLVIVVMVVLVIVLVTTMLENEASIKPGESGGRDSRASGSGAVTMVAMSTFHHFGDHVHQHSTQNDTTRKTVAVGHDQTGAPNTLLDHKGQVAEDDSDQQQRGSANNLLPKIRNSSKGHDMGCV